MLVFRQYVIRVEILQPQSASKKLLLDLCIFWSVVLGLFFRTVYFVIEFLYFPGEMDDVLDRFRTFYLRRNFYRCFL